MGGIVLLFIAGEEISWGQRIFGYSTPDWIVERNLQREFNLHNLHDVYLPLEVGFRYGVQFLCMMACMAFFTGRKRIWGIPVPSILLTLGLLTIFSYNYNLYLNDLFVFTLSALSGIHNTLICLIIIFALFFRQYELLIFSAVAILFPLVLAVVNHIQIFPTSTGFGHEVVEYLITFGIFCYSIELFLNQKPFIQADHWVRRSTPDQGRESIRLFFRRFVRPVGRSLSCVLDPHPPESFSRPLWLAIAALSISMSIGLVSSAYVAFWSRDTSARNLAQEITSREPIIRSRFNVYLSQNRIIYYKERCRRSDVSWPFFLYVIPTDLHEFPIVRRFTFFEYGGRSTALYRNAYRNASYWDGVRKRGTSSCFLVQPLPRWEIAGIGTGQENRWGAVTPVYRYADDGGGPADRFERDADRFITSGHHRMYNAVVSREPRVRSDFDIYLYGRLLIFAKEPCMRADIEAAFFLHVIPVDNTSLPSYRQEHRFDNLDFRFSDFGTVFDDKCIAFVPLPAYDMSRIRTGQHTSEKSLWQVEFPFHK